jgi:two-component system response regulator NreC
MISVSDTSAMTAEQNRTDDAGTITIILADDHEIVRDGLRRIVEAEGDMEVVAEADDADAARRRTSGLKPGVLVLDLNMPGESSLASIPAILEESP